MRMENAALWDGAKERQRVQRVARLFGGRFRGQQTAGRLMYRDLTIRVYRGMDTSMMMKLRLSTIVLLLSGYQCFRSVMMALGARVVISKLLGRRFDVLFGLAMPPRMMLVKF